MARPDIVRFAARVRDALNTWLLLELLRGMVITAGTCLSAR